MLVQVYRHSEAHKQGDVPKYTGEYQGPVRTLKGFDEALVLLEDGHFVTAEFENLVVEKVTKPVITKTSTKLIP